MIARLIGAALVQHEGCSRWVEASRISRAVTGAVIQRVIANIAAAWNPADKFWRSGDILDAIGIATSLITRVVLISL